MTFQEKSTLTMTATLVLVFGWYFALILGPIAGSPEREIAYTGLMVAVVIVLVILAAVSHAVLAIVFRSQANSDDERDRFIALRSERIAAYILAVGVCAGIWLAIVQSDTFWIAQALIATLVLAEVTEGVTRLTLYRLGA
ncbi:MAG: hypothetical protein WCF36_18850 [Candidatus Nanopelagicales bacterium]